VLFAHYLKFDPQAPNWADRDRFVLSAGHGSMLLYSLLHLLGYEDMTIEELQNFRQIGSRTAGHPEFGHASGIETTTGPLGQGLSACIGMALGAGIRGKDFRSYALLGDGESAEGQVWEAAMSAAKFKLDNLVAIIDYNKFALCDRVNDVMPLEPLGEKWIAFGWHVIEVNGHSVIQLINAFEEARGIKGKPTVIIAHTVKARGVSFFEDTAKSHSVSMTDEQVENALNDLGCPKQEIEETLAIIKEKH
jgi:transketolase